MNSVYRCLSRLSATIRQESEPMAQEAGGHSRLGYRCVFCALSSTTGRMRGEAICEPLEPLVDNMPGVGNR